MGENDGEEAVQSNCEVRKWRNYAQKDEQKCGTFAQRSERLGAKKVFWPGNGTVGVERSDDSADDQAANGEADE